MHRDKKVGLALGILLLGVVTALFFRTETGSTPEPPELSDPEGIEKEIAERDLLPYPTGIEPIDDDPDESAKPDESILPLPGRDGNAVLHRLPGAAGPPDPIRDASTDHGPEPAANVNQGWEVVPTGSPDKDKVRAKPVGTSGSTRGSRVMHRVRKGDTLSELAARYLGHSARFLEIFEANRDVLKSPDDLPVGTLIRIPTGETTRPAKTRNDALTEHAAEKETGRHNPRPARPAAGGAPGSRPTVAPVPRSRTPNRKAPPRFVPVRRLPLMPWARHYKYAPGSSRDAAP